MSIYSSISAGERRVFMEINKRNKDSYTKVNRAPERISLDVVYDTDTQCVTVNGDDGMEVEVFLYNSLREVEDYSSYLNTTLSISSPGIHQIHIEGEDWVANGIIEI